MYCKDNKFEGRILLEAGNRAKKDCGNGGGSKKDGAGYGSLLRRSLYKLELRKVFFEASPRNDGASIVMPGLACRLLCWLYSWWWSF